MHRIIPVSEMIKILILISILFIPCSVISGVETKSFNSADIKTLDVRNGCGSIKIGATKGAVSTVGVKRINASKGCNVSMRLSDGILRVKVRNDDWIGGDECTIDLDIKIPRNTGLNIKNGAGLILINDTSGDVDFKSGSGDVKIKSSGKLISGKAGSGEVTIEGAYVNTDITVGSGDLTIKYNKCWFNGYIDIRSGSGNSYVSLPSGCRLFTSLKSGSGELYNDFENIKNSTFSVSVKSGSGNLTVKKLK